MRNFPAEQGQPNEYVPAQFNLDVDLEMCIRLTVSCSLVQTLHMDEVDRPK